MYKDNMWGLLGLYQCLKEVADPEVSSVSKNEESKASSPSSIHGKAYHHRPRFMFITLVLTPFHCTTTTLFCIDQL